ncbi:MAG: nucleotide exchange factor GrpE [Actinomycetaceae bacterium]
MTTDPEREAPVVNDRRRIDPETGKVREPGADAPGSGPDQPSAGEPAEGQAGATTSEAPTSEDATAGTDAPAEGEPDALAAAQGEVLELQDQLARRKADVYNVEQEYAAFVRRSRQEAGQHKASGVESVVTALFGVLDDLALARQHGDLTGPFLSIADRLEQALTQQFGFERYGEVGEEFDPAIHEALMSSPGADLTVDTIDQVLQPGYRLGEKVLRPARVSVHSAG